MTHKKYRIALCILVIGLAANYQAKPQQVGQVAANAPYMGTCTIMQVRDNSYHIFECQIQPNNLALIRM